MQHTPHTSRPIARRVRRTLRQWRRRVESRVVVLMYHRVADVPCDPWDQCVTPEHFDEQLDILKRHLDVIPLSEVAHVLEAGPFASRAAVITFDDGYADNLCTARPLLDRHGLPATFFLTTGALGVEREFWWDELERIFLFPDRLPSRLELMVSGRRKTWFLGEEACQSAAAWGKRRAWRACNPPETKRQGVYLAVWDLLRPLPAKTQEELLADLAAWAGVSRNPRPSHRILTRGEAQTLAGGSGVEIGAHSVSHSALSVHPRAAQADEIRESKKSLESLLNRPVRHFAYPYGDFSPDTTAAVTQAGFSAALTTREGLIGPRGSRWMWPRCKVYDWNGEEFAHRLHDMLQHG